MRVLAKLSINNLNRLRWWSCPFMFVTNAHFSMMMMMTKTDIRTFSYLSISCWYSNLKTKTTNFSQHTKSQKNSNHKKSEKCEINTPIRYALDYKISARFDHNSANQILAIDSKEILWCKNMLFLVALTIKESTTVRKKRWRRDANLRDNKCYTHILLMVWITKISHRSQKCPALLNSLLHVLIQLKPISCDVSPECFLFHISSIMSSSSLKL